MLRGAVAGHAIQLAESALGGPVFLVNDRRTVSNTPFAITTPLDDHSCFARLRRRIQGQYDRDISTARKVAMKEAFGGPTIVTG
jgi:hypothetical protein